MVAGVALVAHGVGVTVPAAAAPVVTAAGAETDSGGRLVAVGDSIMLGARSELERRAVFLGIRPVLDMEVSRSTSAGADALANHGVGPRDVVVIGLGANDSGNPVAFRSRVERVLDAGRNAAAVYWLTIAEVRPYYPAANQVIRDAASSRPNVSVIDWADVESATPGLVAGDGLHLRPSGSAAMADLIIRSVLGGVAPVGNDAVPGEPAATAVQSPTSSGDRNDEPSSAASSERRPGNTRGTEHTSGTWHTRGTGNTSGTGNTKSGSKALAVSQGREAGISRGRDLADGAGSPSLPPGVVALVFVVAIGLGVRLVRRRRDHSAGSPLTPGKCVQDPEYESANES